MYANLIKPEDPKPVEVPKPNVSYTQPSAYQVLQTRLGREGPADWQVLRTADGRVFYAKAKTSAWA